MNCIFGQSIKKEKLGDDNMNTSDAWNKFCTSGKIEDYLDFKNIQYGRKDGNADINRSAGDKSDGCGGK